MKKQQTTNMKNTKAHLDLVSYISNFTKFKGGV